MDLNATLLVQMLCFIVFIVVTMKYIWPPIISALEERRQKIADGLAAAEQGQKDLELAQIKKQELLNEAKQQGARILEMANQRSNKLVEEAKSQARNEAEHLLQRAKNEIEQEYHSAKEKLMTQIAELATVGAEKILKREMNAANNAELIKEISGEI